VRILHLDSGIDWRGGQQQIEYLVGGLKRLGVQQYLVLRRKGKLACRLRQLGVPISTLSFSSELAPLSVLKLRKLISQFQPAIIHAHDSRTLGMAALLRFLGEKAKIAAARRVAFPIRKNPFWELKYGKAVDRIVAVSKFIRDQLIRAGIAPGKVELVYDGYALGAIQCEEGRMRARQSLGIAEGDWVLGCIGQFTSEKGHECLIRGLKILRDKSSGARLVLVGDGPLRRRYQTLIGELGLANHVILPGFVADPGSLLPAFDLYVLPSLNEGLGSTLLMAMAQQIPVCASRTGGIPELVIEGETGSLFAPGDPEALAETVLRCARDKALTPRMAETACRRVRADFAVERMVSETYKIYINVLSS
jgi:glycosyltransferase involved in cell wall biosynthesis